ncbi:ATP-binding protein [Novosphingobium beihaiensis]|nr:ATP-binding protein [Novosphingobium beihaiensis]
MTAQDKNAVLQQGLALRLSDVPLLGIYALAFGLLHWAAQPWGGAGFFSLWYPAAGLRFAVLWQRGARLAPWLMASELCVHWITGALPLSGPNVLPEAIGGMRPAFAYGLAVAGVRWLTNRGTGALTMPPMPLGLAALAAPVLAALFIIPLALLRPDLPGTGIHVSLVISLTGFAVGDMLGVLVVAPPLLWFSGSGSVPRNAPLPRPAALIADGAILMACLLLTVALWRAGLGLQPIPSVLAGAWIGLRHGRIAAWFAILAEVALFLPYTAGPVGDATRLELHLGIAAVVIVTWLAGSFADAQEAARTALDKRNRLLFQAERLKTLRAMSVAVIHEISQPLSTLAIEASHLKDRTAALPPDIAESAALIDRKARTLSELVRRLRRFGGRNADAPSALPVTMLLQTAGQMLAPELREHACLLQLVPAPPDLIVTAQEIELTQALVNLARNAIAASADHRVQISATAAGDEVRIEVSNRIANTPPQEGAGMGVGLIIARTIAEAHGGTLTRNDEADLVRFALTLPLAGVET